MKKLFYINSSKKTKFVNLLLVLIFFACICKSNLCIAKQKISISQAFNMAINKNRSIKIYEQKILASNLDAGLINFFPNANISLSAGYDLRENLLDEKNGVKSLNFNLPINYFEKILSYNQKKCVTKLSNSKLVLKRLECLVDVAKKFYFALAIQNILYFLQENLEISKMKVDEYKKKLSAGTISQNEFNEVILNYNIEVLELAKKEHHLNEAKVNFKTAIDWQEDEDFELEGEFKINEKVAEQFSIASIGEIHYSEAINKNKLNDLKKTKAYLNYLPSLSTGFSFNFSNIGNVKNDYSFNISLNLDLYKVITTKTELDLIDIDIDNENLELGLKTKNLEEKMRMNLQKIRDDLERLALAQNNVDLSSIIYKEYLKKFDLKLISRIELEEAKKKYHKAKIYLEESKLNTTLSIVEILYIQGDIEVLQNFLSIN